MSREKVMVSGIPHWIKRIWINWIVPFAKSVAPRKSHWFNSSVTFAIVFIAGGILLPVVRVYPASVHQYFAGLQLWMRAVSSIAIGCTIAYLMFNLFRPRLSHILRVYTDRIEFLTGQSVAELLMSVSQL